MTSNTINNDVTMAGSEGMLLGRSGAVGNDLDAKSMNDAVTMVPGGGLSLGRIDQYELVRELGGGGFGTVFLAKDTVAGIEVAVKGLPPFVKNNREEVENIRDNFALVSRLTHTNIAKALVLHPAKYVSYSSEDVRQKLRVLSGDTLMVMEYAPGVTLSKWRKQFPQGKVPFDTALSIVRQIASALDYAHGQKILHRDIKPANIMVETRDDERLVARVLDFGLAAEIRSSIGRVSREIHDTSGTRPYMAPEQWGGARQGPTTDQYSLAVLFHELVTGVVPFASIFDTGDPVVMMNVVGNKPFKASNEFPKSVRRALEKALSKKPAERFANCCEFVKALEVERHNNFLRVVLVAALFAALCGAGVLWLDRHDESNQPTDEAVYDDIKEQETPSKVDVPTPKPICTNEVAETNAPPSSTSTSTNVTTVISPANAVAGIKNRPVKPSVDLEYIRLTNNLSNAFKERDKAYKSSDEFRKSLRGFQSRLDDIDGIWRKRTTNGIMRLTKDEAYRMLNVVTNETANISKNVKWMRDNKRSRDEAIQEEATFLKSFNAEKDSVGPELFVQIARRDDWLKLLGDISSVSNSINSGVFENVKLRLDKCLEEARKLLKEAKEQYENQAKEKHIKELLDRKGFLVDTATNKHEAGTPRTILLPRGEEMHMVWCPPGWFMMGSPEHEDGRDDSLYVETQHAVRLTKGFWIGKYEVTESQWRAVVGSGGSSQKPKANVTYEECVEFCRKLPSKYGARVPTEAEWEYACRAGTTTPYSLGSRSSGQRINGSQANVKAFWGVDNVGSYESYANAWGICDMHGNVREWCSDIYGTYKLGATIAIDPNVTAVGVVGGHVVRGGACNEELDRCRCAARTQGKKDGYTGFRICCDNLDNLP